VSRVSAIAVFCLTSAVGVLNIPGAAAKKAPEPTGAPIPVQVITGKKVFISYRESDADPGAPDLTYNEFYALMKDWGKIAR